MKNYKRGQQFGGLIRTLVLIVVVIIALFIVKGPIYTIFGGLINWTMQITGLDTGDDGIREREKQVIEELEQIEQEKRQKAIEFFNKLMGGYESCLSDKGYSNEIYPTLAGACNCGSKVDPSPLEDYAIDFNFDSTQGITTFKLKAPETIILAQKSLNQIFKPCKFDSLRSQQFPINCQTARVLYENLKIETYFNELMLAKGKNVDFQTGTETGQGIIFFSDTGLPQCPSK